MRGALAGLALRWLLLSRGERATLALGALLVLGALVLGARWSACRYFCGMGVCPPCPGDPDYPTPIAIPVREEVP